MNGKLLLIDGHSILNRAFYGLPLLTNGEGVYTNAVLGFLNIMFKIIDEEQADYLTVAFDLHEPTFRHKAYADYKGTRHAMPEELRSQVPLIKEVLTSMGIKIVTLPGFEADDLLGTLSKRYEKEGLKVCVLSGDRDLLQLASEDIMIRIPKTKQGKTEVENYNTEDVVKTYGVTPTEFIDLKALQGDTSDNIKGAPGIGEKTARALIEKFHSIDEIYARIDEVTPPKAKKSMEENVEDIRLSRFLVTINTEAPVEYDINDAKIDNLYTKEAFEMFKRLGFKSLLSRFDKTETSASVVNLSEMVCWVNDFDDVFDTFKAAAKSKVVGVGINVSDKELTGVSLCFGDKLYYIPVQMFVTEDMLKDELGKLNKVSCIVANDVKEQLDYYEGFDKKHFFDIGLAAYIINPLKDSYSPDDISLTYLGESIDIPKKDNVLLAIANAYVSFKSKEVLEQKLKDENMYNVYMDIDFPLLFVLYDMEKQGIRVDRNALVEYGDTLKVRIDELEKNIYELAGESFNINSPKQLGEVLFEKLGLTGGKKTKTGYSTSADVLEKLKGEHEIIPAILEYRQLTKLHSTYAIGLLDCISPDGRIHTKFNQTITATGRISSTEPNLQNIPVRMELGRLIRKVFIPKDGYVFVDADYSQIELRIMAHMSGDKSLIDAYNEAKDVHAITASEVFGVPLNEVTPLQRRNAKAVNFGIIYGISAFGLSEDLGLSRKEATEYINKYFETYPGVKAYLDDAVSDAKKLGYSITLFGRKRPIPEIKASNFMTRQFGERVAMNSPIQGTAADIMKIAMIKVFDRLEKEVPDARIILQIHDELMIEASREDSDKVLAILSEEMMDSAKLAVKLEVDAHTGNDWYEVK